MKEFINAVITIIADFFIIKPIDGNIFPEINKYLSDHSGVTIFMLAMLIIYSILATYTSISERIKYKKQIKTLQEKLESKQESKLRAAGKIYLDQYDHPFCVVDKLPLSLTYQADGPQIYTCMKCTTTYDQSVIDFARSQSK